MTNKKNLFIPVIVLLIMMQLLMVRPAYSKDALDINDIDKNILTLPPLPPLPATEEDTNVVARFFADVKYNRTIDKYKECQVSYNDYMDWRETKDKNYINPPLLTITDTTSDATEQNQHSFASSNEAYPYFVWALLSPTNQNFKLLKEKRRVLYAFEKINPNNQYKGWQVFTDEQKKAVRRALSEYTEVTGIEFIEEDKNPNLRFYLDNLTTVNRPPETRGYFKFEGNEIHISTTYYPKSDALNSNKEGYHTLLHEIGHFMGLKHPFTEPKLPLGFEYRQTNMNRAKMPANKTFKYHLHLLPYDIASVQALYGINKKARLGNDCYTFADKYIWDAGGIDTFDGSGHPVHLVIDLRQGQQSHIFADKQSRFSRGGQSMIGRQTQIENAKGGLCGDFIVGNELNNVLEGGDGDDFYYLKLGGIDEIIDKDIEMIALEDVDFSALRKLGNYLVYNTNQDALKVDFNNVKRWAISDKVYTSQQIEEKILYHYSMGSDADYKEWLDKNNIKKSTSYTIFVD